MGLNAAAAGVECPADHLQQGRFAAAVAPDDADSLPFFNFKRNVFKRPKFPKVLLWFSSNAPLESGHNKLLESVMRVGVDLVAFA